MADLQFIGPLVKKDIILNDVQLTLVTHQQDHAHGAMFRGEFPVSPSYLAELEVLQDLIRPGHRVLDAGANIGSVALVLAKCQPDAVIYCFEPDLLNFSLLNLNIVLNRVHNIHPFNYALGKRREYINLYLSQTNFGDHRSFKCAKTDLNEDRFECSAVKILKVNPAEFFQELSGSVIPPSMDLIKIDTQGADFEILESCRPLFKPTTVVAIEYSPYHLDAGGMTKDALPEVLESFAKIQKINPLGETPRLSEIELWPLLEFYDEQSRHYSTEYDLILTCDALPE